MLNELANKCFENSKAHGFWDEENPHTFPAKLALIHSEVSEAMEAHRKVGMFGKYSYDESNPLGKPEGVGAELADVIIRVLDLCGRYQINIDLEVETKMAYNERRPYLHGRKY